MQRTISITRALAELKNLDSRIQSASTAFFVGQTVGLGTNQRVVNSNATVDAYSTELVGNYQRVDQLIQNRQSLKSKIVISNANTTVNIGNRSMTVAEAIEYKTSINNKRVLLNNLRHQLLGHMTQVDQQNAVLDAEINKLVSTIYGADKSKINDETYKQVADPQKAMKQRVLLDPNNVQKLIEKLEAEVQAVDTELDFTLSESNAKTVISVDF